MTEFLVEYGLFLAKAVTFVVALLFLVSGIVQAASRNRHREDEGTLRVRHLSKEIDALKEDLRHEILPEHLRKLELKQHKKDEKKKRKAEKKGADDVKPRVFVLDFDGDVHASEVDNLRREISAVLQVAEAKDEVVVRLESPGGWCIAMAWLPHSCCAFASTA